MPLLKTTISICLVVAVSTAGYLYKTSTLKSAHKPGIVVILNGTSAVGKSSIQKAFSNKCHEPWLNIGIDNFFVGVLPPKFYLEDTPAHREIMHGVANEDAEGKLFTLTIGKTGLKIIKGMHRAIAGYAREGNNIIVDYIAYDPAWQADLLDALSGMKVITVGVTASLETVQNREKSRATSPEGHARSIYNSVHNGWNYDLNIDTDNISAEQAAEEIIGNLKIK